MSTVLKTFQLAILSALVCVFAAQAQTVVQQEPQSGQPAQPSSAIYNRMRHGPMPAERSEGQSYPSENPQAQAPNQQLPQQRRMYFPHPTLPPNQAQPAPAAPPQQPPVQQAPIQQAPAMPQQNAGQHAPYGLALQPPNPPQVSFAQGELTVTANNSSLLDVLNGVERATGAHVEGAQADSERVFGRFGPGTPRQVLDSLLSGSRYDFILLGSLEDPGDVQRIVLTQRGNAPPTTAQNQPQYRPPEPEEQSDNEPVYQPETPEPPQPAPETAAPETPQQQQVKTPEQLLQELQRLRQQQQRQQQQNPH